MVTWTPLSPYVLVHLFTSDLVSVTWGRMRVPIRIHYGDAQRVRHLRLAATLPSSVAGRSEKGTLWNRAVGSRVVNANATTRVGGISRWLVELNDEA